MLTGLTYAGFLLVLRQGSSDLRRPAGPLFDCHGGRHGGGRGRRPRHRRGRPRAGLAVARLARPARTHLAGARLAADHRLAAAAAGGADLGHAHHPARRLGAARRDPARRASERRCSSPASPASSPASSRSPCVAIRPAGRYPSRRSYASAARTSSWTASGPCAPSTRRSSPRSLVVRDERLRLAVVDAQALADRLRIVVLAALVAAADPLHHHVVGHVDAAPRAVSSRPRARGRRPAPPPARPCAGSRRAGSAGPRAPRRRHAPPRRSRRRGRARRGPCTRRRARPRSVPAARASRSRSPVESATNPSSSRRRAACVPFPLPGGPSSTITGAAMPPTYAPSNGRAPLRPPRRPGGLLRLRRRAGDVGLAHPADQAGARARHGGAEPRAARVADRPDPRDAVRLRRSSSAGRARSSPAGAWSRRASAMVLPALAWNLGSLAAALLLLGFSLGTLDIAMNTQGVAIERGYARPIMSGIHGMYSVGVLVGAAVGAVAAHADVDPLVHFTVAALVLGTARRLGLARAARAGGRRARLTRRRRRSPAAPRPPPAADRARGDRVLLPVRRGRRGRLERRVHARGAGRVARPGAAGRRSMRRGDGDRALRRRRRHRALRPPDDARRGRRSSPAPG